MNPKAGRGRFSFEPVLKIVALVGFVGLSMVGTRYRVPVVVVGGTANEGWGGTGTYGEAGLAAIDLLAILLGGTVVAEGFLGAFLRASIFLPSSRVRAMVLVLSIFFCLWLLRNA